jgi:hypothetical protein
MSVDENPAWADELDGQVVSELNAEMLERVREVAHTIEERVRKVTVEDLYDSRTDSKVNGSS